MSVSTNQPFLSVRKDIDTIRKTVLTNIIKMLVARKWLKEENMHPTINTITEMYNDDNIYKIKLTTDLDTLYSYSKNNDKDVKTNDKNKQEKTFDGSTIIIKLLPQKVTGVNKSPIITEFLNTYKKYHKILIVDSISDKAKNQILDILHTEVFTEDFFMINLPDHECSPVGYEILSPEQEEQFLSSYDIKKSKLLKIYDNDVASSYYYLKEGQIVRIIRNSELTGHSSCYRLVVHKSASVKL